MFFDWNTYKIYHLPLEESDDNSEKASDWSLCPE